VELHVYGRLGKNNSTVFSALLDAQAFANPFLEVSYQPIDSIAIIDDIATGAVRLIGRVCHDLRKKMQFKLLNIY